MLHCLLTIAFVCLGDASKVDIDAGGLMRFARVRIGSADVSITLDTDNIATLDRARMHRACGDDACVAYHKFCQIVPAGVECSYHLAGRPFTAPALSIRAPDRATLVATETRIDLVGEGQARWQVPLSRLSTESPEERPPSCLFEGDRTLICFEAVLARLERVAAFEIKGDEQFLAPIITVAAEQGWRVETTREALAPGSGWTVYAPSSASPLTIRISPPPRRKPDDVRKLLIAIEPLLGLGTDITALDPDGREIEPR